MKKKTCLLGAVLVLSALLAFSGVAQSAMWVGAQLGGTFSPSTSFDIGGFSSNGGQIAPAVIGGMTLGYDFINAGFGAYAWPDWMKYFSFALDFTYNRLMIQSGGPGLGQFFPPNSRLNGYEAVWTFLFMAHYGFLPDSEVPSGRVNPYIGIGPAIILSGADTTFFAVPVTRTTNTRASGSGVNVGLVVEPGIRFMALKNVSIDTAFRWRYSQPSWDFDNATVKANPLNQFAFLLRANYHF
jgi:hypothetical protein